jgi:hypothetical protein
MASNHPVLWTAPAPLAGRFGGEGAAVAQRFGADSSRPALLRFDNDAFMDQLLATLAVAPRDLGRFIARPETWRSPQAAAPEAVAPAAQPALARTLARRVLGRRPPERLEPVAARQPATEQGRARTLPLKLYQAAHQRHYLVAAQLVCGLPGLPDRALPSGGREKVGCVIRRLLPVATGAGAAAEPREEFAYVKDATGARWQRLGAEGRSVVADGEELLPLFPMAYTEEPATARTRRLWVGSVPVGRREEYLAARAERAAPGSAAGVAAAPSAIATRKEQFRVEVAEPWKNLVRTAALALPRLNQATDGPGEAERRAAAGALNEQLQAGSWLTLLDLADWLRVHLPALWRVILGEATPDSLALPAQRTLYDWLATQARPVGGTDFPFNQPPAADAAHLADALALVTRPGVREGLERTSSVYPHANDGLADDGTALRWPGFKALLAGVRRTGPASYVLDGPFTALPAAAEPEDPTPPEPPPGRPRHLFEAEQAAARIDRLVQMVVAALGDSAAPPDTPPLPYAVTLRDALVTTAGDEGWFCIRFVHLRCDCGPLHEPLLSDASERFQLASFFDPDAPARPIRIALPLDTTAAGLRKHPKNAVLMVSDVLCGQIQRAKGLGLVDLVLSVLPWPLNKPLNLDGMSKCRNGRADDIGMICSLSIPIVTLCALILLMIIVSLLDFIFRWLPWFVMCLPVPGLKGKR